MVSIERIPAFKKDGHLEINLAQAGSSFFSGLVEPIRVVAVRVGSVVFQMPRGANDITPDNVVKLSGLYHNLTDGRVSKNLSDVS